MSTTSSYVPRSTSVVIGHVDSMYLGYDLMKMAFYFFGLPPKKYITAV